MKFFKDIKDDLERLASDLTTVEHALLQENTDGQAEVIIYRRQELDGDSLVFLTSKKVEPESLEAFNLLFQAATISRLGILRALIKIL